MVIRIHNVTKWRMLEPGESLTLNGTQERKVRVEVNCVAPTRFDLVEGDKPYFIAIVQGLETLEFVASPEAVLAPTSDGEVWYFTNDGDDTSTPEIEATSFTKLATRRVRNPELEKMMFLMEQNMNRRFAALEEENAALRGAAVTVNTETGEVSDADSDATASDDTSGATAAAGGAAEPAATGTATVDGGNAKS